MGKDSINSDEKYESLINEFIDQRNAIKIMITDLEKYQEKIGVLFPDTIDKRFVRLFEEKVKAMTELFRVILDMRKEIIKNTKDEIELRKRYIGGDDNDIDVESIFNIKKIAEKVEKLRKDKIQIEHKIEEAIVIPNTETENLILNEGKFEINKEKKHG